MNANPYNTANEIATRVDNSVTKTPAFRSRLQIADEELRRSTAMKDQAIAADALFRVNRLAVDPIERRRAAKALARLTRHMAALASLQARRRRAACP